MTQDDTDAPTKFSGRDSAFYVNRLELDIIMAAPNSEDVAILFLWLISSHGHKKQCAFALDFSGMRESGKVNISAKRLRAARRYLEAVGIVELVSKHKAGSVHQKFRLVRPGTKPGWTGPKYSRESKDQMATRAASGYRSDVFEIDDVVDA